MGKSKQKFYAVSNGRQIGIYTCWGQAEEQVHGYKGSVFKGYPTLREAIQDMRVNGYSDPPLFEHRNIQIEHSHSDTDLSMPVHQVDQLPVENQPILVLEHADLGLEQTIPCTQSSSDTLVKTLFSPTTTCNESQIGSISRSDTQKPNNTMDSLNNSTTTEVSFTINQISSSTQTDECSFRDLYTLISHMNDKIDRLEERIEEQCCLNQELNSLLKQQNEQFHQEKVKLDQTSSCIDSIASSIESINQNTQITAEDMTRSVSCLQQQNVQIEKTLNSLSNDIHHQKMESLKTNEKLEEMKHLRGTSNIQGDEMNTISKSTTHPPQTLDLSCSNESPSPKKSISTTELIQSDDDDLLRHHPVYGDLGRKQCLNSNIVNQPRKMSLRISNKLCKNILLGDSNLKMVDRSRLDKTKSTEVRTYRGASVRKLDEYVASADQTYPDVERLSLSVGSVDCARRYVDAEVFINDYENLLSTAEKIFPNAAIGITSIPPNGNPQTTKNIWKLNNALKSLTKNRNHRFCNCDSLWTHVNPSNGDVDNGLLYPDKIHLTPYGVALLLRPIKSHFFSHLRREENKATPSSAGKNLSESNKDHQKAPETSPDYLQKMRTFSNHIAQKLSESILVFTQQVVPNTTTQR